ncbi:hypothetical protein ONZ45_g13068 [Pleurotus djamor]|nr:hypothetical protein ONZ45_g13068 [Pleurotus djamor]
MQTIPNELVYQIIEALALANPQALYPLLFVSKSAYHFSIPFFYTSIIIQDTPAPGSGGTGHPTSNHRHGVFQLSPLDEHTTPRPSSLSHRLPRLHHTLTHAPALAAYVKTFIVGPFLQRDEEFLWGSVGGILQLLINLKRLSLDPSPDKININSLFNWIYPQAKLTHLSCSLSNDNFRDILKLISSQAQSIEFIRVMGRSKNEITSFADYKPFGKLPNLRSVEGLPGIWHFFATNGAKLEHLAALDLPMFALSVATDPNPSRTYRNIRTIHLSSSVPATFDLVLPHLACIELLHIGFPVYGSKIPLTTFLQIPSNQLKYLRVASVGSHGEYCQRIFEQFPSLLLIDIVTLTTRRFTREHQDYGYNLQAVHQIQRSVQRKERHGMFDSWWEAFKGDLNDADINFKP